MDDAGAAAWAAGLFEGEGCIYLKKHNRPGRGTHDRRLYVTSTDLDVLQRFRSIVACGAIYAGSNHRVNPAWTPDAGGLCERRRRDYW